MQIPVRLRSPKSIGIFLLSLVLLTSCDFYPETGKWEGSVRIIDSHSRDSYSCPMQVEISRTQDAVIVRGLDLYCGSHSVHWSPDAYTRRGTDLMQNGRRVGDIYPDGTVRLELTDPYYNDRYPERVGKLVLTWSRIGETLQFSLREETEGFARSMEGSLVRVP